MLTHVEEYPGKLAGLLSASSITRAVVLREFQRDVAAWHAARVGVCAFSVVKVKRMSLRVRCLPEAFAHISFNSVCRSISVHLIYYVTPSLRPSFHHKTIHSVIQATLPFRVSLSILFRLDVLSHAPSAFTSHALSIPFTWALVSHHRCSLCACVPPLFFLHLMSVFAFYG